jgi:hypothetical protein
MRREFLSRRAGAGLDSGLRTSAFELTDRSTTAARLYLANTSNIYLNNYIQEDASIDDYLRTLGDKIGRQTLVGSSVRQT